MSEQAQQTKEATKRVYRVEIQSEDAPDQPLVQFVRATTRQSAENSTARKLLAEQAQRITARAATVDDFIGGVEVVDAAAASEVQ